MGLLRGAPPPSGCALLAAMFLAVQQQVAAQCNVATDADCFRQFLAGRTSVDPLPECDGEQAADGSALSGSWCRCAASLGGAEGSLGSFVGWIDDDSCDRLFDTDACYADGGDCTPSVRRVLTHRQLIYSSWRLFTRSSQHVSRRTGDCTKLTQCCALSGTALSCRSGREGSHKCLWFRRGSCREFRASSNLHARLCRVVPPMAERVLMGRGDWGSAGLGVGRL